MLLCNVLPGHHSHQALSRGQKRGCEQRVCQIISKVNKSNSTSINFCLKSMHKRLEQSLN